MESLSQESVDSFEAVYNKYYRPVYSYFLKRLNTKELCEDLTNDVFYSCLKSFEKYDSTKSSMSTWIYCIANNKLKNYYRDRKNTVTLEDSGIIDIMIDGTDMENAIFISEMKAHIATALESVTERERIVINRRFFYDFSTDEIAKEIGTTAGNTRVILTRTLKKLEQYFTDNGIRWEW